jgi:Restriction endonuclease
MMGDPSTSYEKIRTELLRLLCDRMDQPDWTVYSGEITELLGISEDEIRRVYSDMSGEHLVMKDPTYNGELGWRFCLLAAGVREAENLGLIDPVKMREVERARQAIVDAFIQQGDHGVLVSAQLEDLGGVPWAAKIAAGLLEHEGYIGSEGVIVGLRLTARGRQLAGELRRQARLAAQLTARFEEIRALPPQRRGRGLEALIDEAIRGQGCRCERDRGAPGEQIDLVVQDDSRFFVCEAKWEKNRIEGGTIAQMVGRMARRPGFYVGVIFSMSGFTSGAVTAASSLANIRVVLLVGEDEVKALIKGHRRFREIVDDQLRALAGSASIC